MIAFILHDVVDGDLATSGLQGNSSFKYKISTSHFKSFLDVFGRFTANKSLSIHDLLAEKGTPEVLLTFDDGGKSAITQIDPILRESGWIGHFFITTKFIGQPGFLDRVDIRELWKRGHIIGSHSHTHPASMANLSADTLKHEWQVSVEILSDILGVAVNTASVPGGSYSPRVVEAVQAFGVKALFTSQPSRKVNRRGDCQVFGRFGLNRETRVTQAAQLCSGNPWVIGKEQLFWNSRACAKWAMGSSYFKIRSYLLRSSSKTNGVNPKSEE
jgi:peptidoglycan/xylan/chitin deacetylase (PgdA/CDA1 family)